MALSDADLTYVQGQLGITDNQNVFTDDELNDYYTRAGDLAGAIAIGFEMLRVNAAKLVNYTAGQTSEDQGTLFDRFEKLITYWRARSSSKTPLILGLRRVPPTNKELPATEEDPANKDLYHDLNIYPQSRPWRG